MSPLPQLYVPSSSRVDSKARNLYSSGSFMVKVFCSALSSHVTSTSSFPFHFVWKSNTPVKVKSFAWLVALKRVNTNDMLQLRRPYKALSTDVCPLCIESSETTNHVFLHCKLSMGLWHRLFRDVHMDWVPLSSIKDTMFMTSKRLGNTSRGKELWKLACLSLMWTIWKERNVRIFEDMTRNSKGLWGIIHFLAYF